MTAQKTLKAILILTALSLMILVSGCSRLEYQTRPDAIRQVADRIAAYSLPEGYSEQFAVDMLGYQMVSLTGPEPSCHIFLAQAPEDSQDDVDDLLAQARTMQGKDREKPEDVHVVEQRPATIRGQAVTLVVGEGVNSGGRPYREVTALFAGNTGPALVSIASPVELWDWALVEDFLASIQ